MTDGTTSTSSALSHADAEALRGTAKWARFLAIVGFVIIGLMVIGGIIMAMAGVAANNAVEDMGGLEQLQNMEGMEEVEGMEEFQESMREAEKLRSSSSSMGMFAGVFGVFFFLVIGVLIFFPNLLLYQFATGTLKALNGPADGLVLTKALNAHRRYYKFAGILTIIVLAIYALFFLFAIVFGASAALF